MVEQGSAENKGYRGSKGRQGGEGVISWWSAAGGRGGDTVTPATLGLKAVISSRFLTFFLSKTSTCYVRHHGVQLPSRALLSTGITPQAGQTLSSHGIVKVIWVTVGPSFQRDCNKNTSVSDQLNVLLQDLIHSRCRGPTWLQAPWKL